MSYKKFRLDINGLRAFAVLSVVLYHFGVPYLSGGFVGVDVFFVISGFLMTGIVLERVDHRGVLDFYIARFLRIVPALVAVILVLLTFGMFELSTNGYEVLGWNAISSLLFYSNNYYAIHSSYFDPSSEFNFLLHTWSLSAEWQFYIAYPLIIIAAKKIRVPVWLTLSTIFAISLSVALLRITGTKEDIFYLLPSRAWEMLAGGLVYMVSARYKLPEWVKKCDGHGIALIVVAVVMLNSDGYWPNISALAPVIGAAIVLLANDQESIFTSNPIAQWAGKISYSVYLWHWPIVVAMKYYSIEFSAINIFLGIIASFVAGDLSYRFIENKFRAKNKLKVNLLVFISVLALSIFIVFTKGVSFRFSDSIKQVVEYRMDNSSWRPDTCFLNPEQDYHDFSRCPDSMTSNSIVVWGDSHAAHLMPGLSSVLHEKGDIVQRTASLCGPLIGMEKEDRPHCKNINNNIAKEISEKRPKAVILAGLWSFYPIKEYMKGTIDYLEGIGVKDIYIIGPFPFWKEPLVDIIEKNGISQGGFISNSFLDDTKHLADDDYFIKKLANEYSNVHYISPINTLCEGTQCKSVVIDDKSYPMQYDFAHMSPQGSIFFAEKIDKYFK
ncbi:TPA: acyltransferase [Citrobacter freundii]|nr:acyltransferase [Citrobacter freundii]HED3836801.1 acyltransferase [Citrobacter freundii]HED3842687.1 acyltransferase [Citrobacter freundii]